MATVPTIPPLEPGDRLTREEFERRYDAMPNLKKAELLEGVVYMPSPVRHRAHSGPNSDVQGWLAHYRAGTPGTDSGDNGSIRLDLENMPQPDSYLILDPSLGGQAYIDEDDYVAGAPEWIGEISASSASYDFHVELPIYQRTGVQEYMIWRVLDKQIDWFALRRRRYEPLKPRSGILKSEVFPGLWLDVQAMVERDIAQVLKVLQRGLASPEHTAFVARLRKKMR